MRSYINCLTSLTLTMFMERYESQKRGIIPFLIFLSVVFSPGLATCGETGGGGGRWNRIKMKLEKLRECEKIGRENERYKLTET